MIMSGSWVLCFFFCQVDSLSESEDEDGEEWVSYRL